MLKLKSNSKIDINFKLVYPIAIRMPEFFDNKNFIFFISKMIDLKIKAKKLKVPINFPIKPDPIIQNPLNGKISSNQPYIFYVCHLGQEMANRGHGLEFAYELSKLIWTTKNWNSDTYISKILNKFNVDLNEIQNYIKKNKSTLVSQIKNNQNDQINAGHHGVPLNVYKGKYFFGQDKPFEDLIDQLKNDRLINGNY